MKKPLVAAIAAAFLFTLSPIAQAKGHGHSHRSSGSGRESHSVEHVHGYTRSDGTYVAPYDRTTPNDTQRDNWSTKGNVNPETGQPGTVTPTH